MSKLSSEPITQIPGVCGGKACIAGHRVRVLDIVCWYEHHGMSADEIVSHIPTITVADVYAALAYYYDHVAEIQQEMREEAELEKEVRRSSSSPPAPGQSN
ncbi:MAG: DUF433 domain-containing protein [Bryobacteraceae bacterium]|nr:DUF433 domain-containing protein [Solibacteraceae bacterium]MCL4840657.1 DUF433 domain-containing protein [Bryobacteraceae bacterium]MCO5350610.1 DUF433 domain-containing protein [Bryobacteraceae bacterium]